MAPVVAKAKKTHGKLVNFISVNTEDAAESSFINKNNIEYIPVNMFYDKQGKLYKKNVGGMNASQLSAILTALEKQKRSGAVSTVSPAQKALKAALKNGKPTVLLFHSKSAKASVSIYKTVNSLKKSHGKKANFVIMFSNNAADKKFIKSNKVTKFPMLFFYSKKGKFLKKHSGNLSKKNFAAYLAKLEK
jgi:thioredoxin-related protein